jgi:HEAT repeat protein
MGWSGLHKQKPDIEALTKDGGIKGLIKALRSDDFETQSRAAKALGLLGSTAMDQLLSELKTRDRGIKLSLIEALGEIKDPRAVASLSETLRDNNAEVRWDSAIALGEIGDESAVPVLKKALEDPDKYVR